MATVPELSLDAFGVFASALDHPECCAFDREGFLWAGGEAGQLYRIDTQGHVHEVANVGSFCGGIAFSLSDELFVCNPHHGILRVERSGRWHLFAHEAGGRRLVEPNYPIFDSANHLYVTDSGGWKAGAGRLLRFDMEGVGSEVASGFSYANGLALATDDRTLFLAESDTNSVYRLTLTGDGRVAQDPELYVHDAGQVPDGLALDVDGNLYVTCYGSHQILRIAPSRETLVFAHDPTGITLGGPTNLTFGGPDARDMYVSNLGRTTIVRARVPTPGVLAANLRQA